MDDVDWGERRLEHARRVPAALKRVREIGIRRFERHSGVASNENVEPAPTIVLVVAHVGALRERGDRNEGDRDALVAHTFESGWRHADDPVRAGSDSNRRSDDVRSAGIRRLPVSESEDGDRFTGGCRVLRRVEEPADRPAWRRRNRSRSP